MHLTPGLTLILEQTDADARGYTYDMAMRNITLNVHSSLEAVGLTAAVSRVLTKHDICANVVGGASFLKYHDRLWKI